MMDTKIIKYVLLSLIAVSCSRQLSINNINRLYYRDFEKDVRTSYKNHQKFSGEPPGPFKDFYEIDKSDVDRKVEIRTQLIDSINLIHKDKWLLVTLYSAGYAGPYEANYIFIENKYYYYHTSLSDIDIFRPDIYEYNIDNLKKSESDDIYKIYDIFYFNRDADSINSNPETLLTQYRIIDVEDKKMHFYKIDSRNFRIEKWK